MQSGSDKVLKDMRRTYNRNQYLTLVNKIKKLSPKTAFTTDVIVGYPTETEEDFLQTIDLCKQVGFSKIHVFPYSRRSMTYASHLTDLNGSIKKDRVNRLMKLSDELQYAYLKQFINGDLEVLFEHSNDPHIQSGHCDYYFKCNVNLSEDLFKQK
ncbi:radical SAM protein [bacterium]|nr:radical SAM protein [bacterium]